MEIGKPKRTYRVEPLQEPVPSKRKTVERPPERRVEPEKVPAR
jgi:hypothetical protein